MKILHNLKMGNNISTKDIKYIEEFNILDKIEEGIKKYLFMINGFEKIGKNLNISILVPEDRQLYDDIKDDYSNFKTNLLLKLSEFSEIMDNITNYLKDNKSKKYESIDKDIIKDFLDYIKNLNLKFDITLCTELERKCEKFLENIKLRDRYKELNMLNLITGVLSIVLLVASIILLLIGIITLIPSSGTSSSIVNAADIGIGIAISLLGFSTGIPSLGLAINSFMNLDSYKNDVEEIKINIENIKKEANIIKENIYIIDRVQFMNPKMLDLLLKKTNDLSNSIERINKILLK